MKNRRVVIIGLLLVFAGALVLSGCGAGQDNSGSGSEKPVVKIGYLPITHSLPLVVADKLNQGKFENFDLELVRFSSWPELTDALNSGTIQGGMTMFEIAMAGKEMGIPQEVVMLSHRNGDVLTVSDEIEKVQDLQGKLVAIPHRLSGHNLLLYKALKDAGLDYQDVRKVEMAPPDMPAALARGEINGYVVAEPFGAQTVVAGTGKVLMRAQDIWPDWICCGLVINPKYFNDQVVLQELVDKLASAGTYIESNQDEAVEIAAEYMQIKKELWSKSLEWISYADLQPRQEDFAQMQSLLLELPWDGQSNTLLKKEIDLSELINEDYAKKAYGKVK
ncbi:ABC transporter substrate-binding protein [Metallumcola ferriviriculae]|uniref:ABC transporter substrate-binding protein n=1 Tax=Metallumcola ferriviriculae TaxID=3039180 RepID=A0AAU0UPF5_9FIRM|nr:ABC transporter substrate-binding protein [Desulfitibacteraceae bacterium MK1]